MIIGHMVPSRGNRYLHGSMRDACLGLYLCKGEIDLSVYPQGGEIDLSYIYEARKLTFLYFCEVGRLTFPSFANEDEGCFLLLGSSLHQSYSLDVLRWVFDLQLYVVHPVVRPRLEPSGGPFLNLC